MTEGDLLVLQTKLDALGPIRVRIDAEVYEFGSAKVGPDFVRFYPAVLDEEVDHIFQAPITGFQAMGKGLRLESEGLLDWEAHPAPDLDLDPGYQEQVDLHWTENAA